MRNKLATLTLALGLALLGNSAEAFDAGQHRPTRHAPAASHGGHDARVRLMQRMQRRHDLRHTYHDRRPRRHMRSM